MAKEAEEAAVRGEISTVYKITKQLCNKNTSKSIPVKSKDGKVLTTEREQAARWVQHFQEILNRPEPDDPANPAPADTFLEIDVSQPTVAEVRIAIKTTKSGRAPGVEAIHAEMLKTDIETSVKVLHDLIGSIWTEEVIPDDWEKGLLTRIAKKGDLRNCDNWRGVTLLSIPSKVFCRILLNIINKVSKLREEQAGFRRGRGCIDQIFALRNILEQSLEWNTPLYVNFIDFKKAFDSVHNDSLWKILRAYGLPNKIVRLISSFYDHFECSIILGNSVSDTFEIKSGVQQGCILSPILFLIVLDWVQRRTTSDKERGIQWTLFSKLEDFDFADDLAEISPRADLLQEKTDRLSSFARKTGISINTTKTKIMHLNSLREPNIFIDGVVLENVDEFTYLGSVISTDNAAGKDIKARLAKAQGAFSQLTTIWKSNQYSLKTMIRLYNSKSSRCCFMVQNVGE